MPDFNSWIDRFLSRWVGLSVRQRYLIIPVLLGAAVLSLFYTINNLSVNTNTRDMLSRDLSWRQLDLAYEQAFPMYVDNILVMVEAPTPDQAADAADYLSQRLQQEDSQYQEIFYARGLEFLQQSALLYLDIGELRDMSDKLAQLQPFLGQLVRDQTLRGLFELIEEARKARRNGEKVEMEPLLNHVGSVTRATAEGKQNYLSWQSLIQGDTEHREIYREYIVIQPRIDYTSLLPGEAAVEAVRSTANNAGLAEKFNAGVRLTGGATLAYEELESVTQGAGIAALLALVVVTFILTAGLRSARLVLASVITLLTGLILTAAMATATVAELNLISVAFAVLYIGLGIDFAIHFCLRFRELHSTMPRLDALRNTGTDIGRSLFLCALTTAIGLYAFIPTDYRGIAELGWISGTGMFISLIVTLTLLPALVAVLAPDKQKPLRTGDYFWRSWLVSLPQRHARPICLAALVLAVAALLLLPRVSFDANTLNLQSRGIESVQAYQDLLAESDASPLHGIVLKKDPAAARELAGRLQKLPEVEAVRAIGDFVPDNQKAKLEIIDELNFLLGVTLTYSADQTSLSAEQRRRAFNDMLAYLEQHPPQEDEPALQNFYQGLQTYREHLQKQPGNADEALATLERHLLQNLPGRLANLRSALDATAITQADLPASLRDRWLSPEGWYLLEILPSANLDDEGAMREFVTAVRGETDDLIGAPVIQLEAGDSVVAAFKEAFALAATAIVLLLLILLRSVRDTLLAITPIALAALLTAAGTVILGLSFNYANIIALPLLLGIGIDNSIHILHRHHMAPQNGGQLLRTSTSRAILVSALTTICSIGNLAFSAHQGTASMGLLLAVGIGISLICALILLPSLLALSRKSDKV